jgi:K+-transporting ATPase ATPase C chain
MMKEFGTQLRISLVFVVLFTVLCGLLYPGVMTLAGGILFPHQASGSLITVNGKTVGSELIGQPFDDAKYFWSRPSATGPFAYNASSSTGSNLGPTNQGFLDTVKGRVDALKKAHSDKADSPVPMDLVTASGSGLDPHISPAAAEYQASRIAKIRNIPLAKVEELIAQNTQGRWLGFIGDPGVNVVTLNLALDGLK